MLTPLQTGTVEELYEAYSTPETQAILERQEQMLKEVEAAEAAEQSKENLILIISIAIGLIPILVIGRKVIQGKTWVSNPAGTAKGIGVALLGGAVLFGLNYGILFLKIKMASAFNTALAFLLVAGIIAGAIWLLTKKDNSDKQPD